MSRLLTRQHLHQLAFTAIRIEGGLIPADKLLRLTTLAQPEATEQTDAHYGTPCGLKLRDEIARYDKEQRGKSWVFGPKTPKRCKFRSKALNRQLP